MFGLIAHLHPLPCCNVLTHVEQYLSEETVPPVTAELLMEDTNIRHE